MATPTPEAKKRGAVGDDLPRLVGVSVSLSAPVEPDLHCIDRGNVSLTSSRPIKTRNILPLP